jgi:CTP synthase
MLICRSSEELSTGIRRKIALFASVSEAAIVSAYDVDNVYAVPLVFRAVKVDDFILKRLSLSAPEPDLSDWEAMVEGARLTTEPEVRIGLVGKYVRLEDAYKSVAESLKHAGFYHGTRVTIDWIDSEEIRRDNVDERLAGLDGILITGGFGGRGIEGKIEAARFAREERIPYLGICVGMQVAVCEFARNIAGMDGANSTEFDPETPYPVIDLLPEQKGIADLGGTMRLGSDPVSLVEGTVARGSYGDAVVYERHRHRYERCRTETMRRWCARSE